MRRLSGTEPNARTRSDRYPNTDAFRDPNTDGHSDPDAAIDADAGGDRRNGDADADAATDADAGGGRRNGDADADAATDAGGDRRNGDAHGYFYTATHSNADASDCGLDTYAHTNAALPVHTAAATHGNADPRAHADP